MALSSKAQPVHDEQWQKEYLERLRVQANSTLSDILKCSEATANVDTLGADDQSKKATSISRHQFQQGVDFNEEPLQDAADNEAKTKRPRRYTAAFANTRKYIRRSRKQPHGAKSSANEDGRARAYTSAAPSDTARQVRVISAEFQRLLASKAEELRQRKQKGTLTDEQLEEQFMRDIGATLRDIADQLREMNLKAAAEKANTEGAENGGRSDSGRLMKTIRAASSRIFGLFG